MVILFDPVASNNSLFFFKSQLHRCALIMPMCLNSLYAFIVCKNTAPCIADDSSRNLHQRCDSFITQDLESSSLAFLSFFLGCNQSSHPIGQ